MLNNPQDISNLLARSFLANREIRSLTIPKSSQIALAIKIIPAESLSAWEFFRSVITQTQRYPIITLPWFDEDYFSRFYYQEELAQGFITSTSPEAIINQVNKVNLEAFLAQKSQTSFSDYLENTLDYSLELIREAYGTSPEKSEITKLIGDNIIQSELELEKWLDQWESSNFPQQKATATVETTYLDWYQPRESLDLLLLPTPNSWESLAYLHWFGAGTVGTPIVIKLLQKWSQKYQAELVCHYGTMLQLSLTRSPGNLNEALTLAWEQIAIAPCTVLLPGVSLREHARALLGLKHWFLHERP